jgi:hypothetical protein
MDSLKDLTSFLKQRESGASMGELKDVFSDEIELKKFIKIGLDTEVIVKDGEKRGTRYYIAGSKIISKKVEPTTNNPKKKDKNKVNKDSDEYSYESTLDHKNIDIYLNSDKPMNGMGVFTGITKFGTHKTNNFKNFLTSGREIKTDFIMYVKSLKKNKIVEQLVDKQYNKIAIRKEGRKFLVIYHNNETSKRHEEELVSYEELREFISIHIS